MIFNYNSAPDRHRNGEAVCRSEMPQQEQRREGENLLKHTEGHKGAVSEDFGSVNGAEAPLSG